MHKRMILLAAAFALAADLTAQFTTTPDQVKEHVYILASDSLLGRGFGTPQGLKAALYIAGQFEKAGIETLDGHYLYSFNARRRILNIPGNNVVGVIRGSNPELKDEYILLGAHFDHLGWEISGGDTVVYNGADDNASGSASLIEIGRNLVERQEELGRSVILVAFDGEESGLIGSNQFLRDSIVPARQIKAMFSLDMIGMVDAHKGLDMIGVKLLYDADYLVGELAEKYELNITKVNNKIEQRTDTAPFGKLGIPAIAPNTGTESPYHKPWDTAEKLDYDGLARVANYMSETTLFLSSRDTLSDMDRNGRGKITGKQNESIRARDQAEYGIESTTIIRTSFMMGKTSSQAVPAYSQISVSPVISNCSPKFCIETKGSRHTDGVFRTHSLTTPLNLQYLTTENEYVRVFFQVGGYFSYHFAGNISGTPIDFVNDYNDREFGITYGAGVEIMKMVQMGIYYPERSY